MPILPKEFTIRAISLTGIAVCAAICCSAQPGPPKNSSAVVSTSDIRLELSAAGDAPRLVSLSGPAGLTWSNDCTEPLPESVEIDGQAIPIHWNLKPELSSADAQRVVFVYESTQPQLRLLWQWE